MRPVELRKEIVLAENALNWALEDALVDLNGDLLCARDIQPLRNRGVLARLAVDLEQLHGPAGIASRRALPEVLRHEAQVRQALRNLQLRVIERAIHADDLAVRRISVQRLLKAGIAVQANGHHEARLARPHGFVVKAQRLSTLGPNSGAEAGKPRGEAAQLRMHNLSMIAA